MALTQALSRQEQRWFFLPPLLALLALAGILVSDSNRTIFLLINQLSAFGGDNLWAHITVLGDAAVVLALLLPWWKRHPGLMAAAVIGALMATLITHGIKPFADVLRPPAVLAADSFHLIGPAVRKHSFPSGHATTIFSFVGIMALLAVPATARWANGARLLLLALAVVVALSRSVVGVHWPVDLLGGFIGGWLSAVFGILINRRYHWELKPAMRFSSLAFPGIAAGMLLFGYGTGYSAPVLMQKIIGGTCLLILAVTLIPRRARQTD